MKIIEMDVLKIHNYIRFKNSSKNLFRDYILTIFKLKSEAERLKKQFIEGGFCTSQQFSQLTENEKNIIKNKLKLKFNSFLPSLICSSKNQATGCILLYQG